MSKNQSIQLLNEMKLHGFAKALLQQLEQPNTYQDLGFEERIAILLDHENQYRQNTRLKRLLYQAKLKLNASPADIDYQHPRGLKKDKMATILSNNWLMRKQNLLITGSTGCGKTYLACAIGNHACLHGISVKYYRSSRLFEALTIAHGDGSYPKLIKSIAKVQLLIIDDWGLDILSPTQRSDLLEIMEDRHENASTLITSQIPTTHWHESIGEPTLADAILDRLIHNAHKFTLNGESMRLTRNNLTQTDQ